MLGSSLLYPLERVFFSNMNYNYMNPYYLTNMGMSGAQIGSGLYRAPGYGPLPPYTNFFQRANGQQVSNASATEDVNATMTPQAAFDSAAYPPTVPSLRPCLLRRHKENANITRINQSLRNQIRCHMVQTQHH